MTSNKVRRAAAILGRAAGKGEVKRRGDAAYYAALRLSRPGTVTIDDMRATASLIREVRHSIHASEYDKHKGWERVAAWLEREAERRERLNEARARQRKVQ